MKYMIKIILLQDALVCRAELTFVDVDTGETTILEGTDLMITETSIFTTRQLRENRRYNVSVTASNSRGEATSYYTNIISEHKNFDRVN